MSAQTITPQRWSDQALLALPEGRWELRGGELRKLSPSGARHSVLSARLTAALIGFVEERSLGLVCDSSGGFRLDEDNCISPDAAFVRDERVPRETNLDQFLHLAPDLVVEVLSPGNTLREIEEKFRLCFHHGTRMAWLVFPQQQHVRVYRSLESFSTAGLNDALDGGDVLPGFSYPLARLFKFPI